MDKDFRRFKLVAVPSKQGGFLSKTFERYDVKKVFIKRRK